jgi:GT2 family glycosyltransferase
MDCCIVLLNWNDADETVKALERLRTGDWSATAVAVLDNGSMDESVRDISAWADKTGIAVSTSFDDRESIWPRQLTLLRSAENLGTTGGPNLVMGQAIEACPSLRHVVVMNNDAEVTWETVEELAGVARESGAGIVGAAIVLGKGSYIRERWPLRLFNYRLATWAFRPEERWWESSSFHGAAVLYSAPFLRRQIAARGRFLDEHLFMYWDEMDLARSAAALGERVVIAGRATVRRGARDGGASMSTPNFRAFYLARNRMTVGKTWLPRPANWLFAGYEIVRVTLVSLLLSVTPRGRRRARAELSGSWDGLRGIGGRWRHHQ